MVVAQRPVLEDERAGGQGPEPQRPHLAPAADGCDQARGRQPDERREEVRVPEADVGVNPVEALNVAGVGVVGERAVPDAIEVARIHDREHRDDGRRACGGLQQRPSPRPSTQEEDEQRRRGCQRAQLHQHAQRRTPHRPQAPVRSPRARGRRGRRPSRSGRRRSARRAREAGVRPRSARLRAGRRLFRSAAGPGGKRRRRRPRRSRRCPLGSRRPTRRSRPQSPAGRRRSPEPAT